jgi:dynein heavy chain 1
MFAGIMAIEFNEERVISAIISREGEIVKLEKPVDIKLTQKVNDWLRALETEMRDTLKALLGRALASLGKFDILSLKWSEFEEWLDAYPVRLKLYCIKFKYF